MPVNTDQSKDFNEFVMQFPLRRYPEGRILISPNEEPEYIFFLESGKVRKYDVTRFRDKVVISVFNSPILFPLSWALNKTPNLYYFEALTAIAVRCVPTDQVTEYLKTDPALAFSQLKQVYFGLENTQRRVVYLTRGNARSRLLFELLIEARRSGEAQPDGSYTITISESDLAERAGLSRETISRELAKVFKLNNVCKRQGRSIVIQNLQELDEMLQRTT